MSNLILFLPGQCLCPLAGDLIRASLVSGGDAGLDITILDDSHNIYPDILNSVHRASETLLLQR